MKVVYLGKRKIKVLAAAAMALVLVALAVFLWQAPSTAVSAAQNKQIPVYCVSTEEKKVSVTFDASWGNEQTEGILDLLDQYNVKATFFLVGYWVDAVSYTHLDVYKRQQPYRTSSRCRPATEQEDDIRRYPDYQPA